VVTIFVHFLPPPRGYYEKTEAPVYAAAQAASVRRRTVSLKGVTCRIQAAMLESAQIMLPAVAIIIPVAEFWFARASATDIERCEGVIVAGEWTDFNPLTPLSLVAG